MTKVDLNFIGFTPQTRWNAIEWLIDQYGPSQLNTWYLGGLDRIYFKNPKHATLFILKWS
jgi:hypothetical protein